MLAPSGLRFSSGLVLACPLSDTSCSDAGPLHLAPTVTGSPTTVDGPFGPSVSFDGSSQYVTYPANEGLKMGVRPEWSFSAWFRATDAAANRYIVQVGSTSDFVFYALHLTATNVRIGQKGSAQDYVSTSAAAVNEWWHVAMRGYALKVDSILTRGSDGRRIVDRQDQTAQAGYTSSAANGQGLIIGAGRVTSVSNHWLGALSRVAMWNRSLNDAELLAASSWSM